MERGESVKGVVKDLEMRKSKLWKVEGQCGLDNDVCTDVF